MAGLSRGRHATSYCPDVRRVLVFPFSGLLLYVSRFTAEVKEGEGTWGGYKKGLGRLSPSLRELSPLQWRSDYSPVSVRLTIPGVGRRRLRRGGERRASVVLDWECLPGLTAHCGTSRTGAALCAGWHTSRLPRSVH